jgi:hypothetical protein
MKTKITKFYIEYILPTTKEVMTITKKIVFLLKFYFSPIGVLWGLACPLKNKKLKNNWSKENEKIYFFNAFLLA